MMIQRFLILSILFMGSACGLFEWDKADLPTLAPSPDPRLPDLTVSNVAFWWSEQWQCGIEVHLTIQNHGDVEAGEFFISLQERREWVAGVPAQSQTTIIIPVSGQAIQRWMRATGTVDINNTILESDETNNGYDKPLPYSAVPGMESIAICIMSQTPPPATPTSTRQAIRPSATPSAMPTPPLVLT